MKKILKKTFFTLATIIGGLFWIGPAVLFAADAEEAGETIETLTEEAQEQTIDPTQQKAQSFILLAICVVIAILLVRRSKMKQQQDKDFGGQGQNPNQTPDHLDDEKKGNHFGF